MLGVRFAEALGTHVAMTDPWLGGRLGKGGCTLRHTARNVHDAQLDPDSERGWIRVRYEAPCVCHDLSRCAPARLRT